LSVAAESSKARRIYLMLRERIACGDLQAGSRLPGEPTLAAAAVLAVPITGLIGLNGAGKTTLSAIIAGFTPPSVGRSTRMCRSSSSAAGRLAWLRHSGVRANQRWR